ncbi:Hypothetical_protein [Hexamita inflata]|uniref:Hypothetical_protein n=1 Tax=Hexamita inflata TaxID=28002 RepID=A0AA86QY00_9EUKA|nr:Hypothetical protein HINF_LOCUS49493 [Hexamita inflata]
MKLKLHHEKLKVVTNQQQAQLKDQQQKHINTIMYIQKQVRNVSAANNVIADMCVRAKDIICVQSVIKRILVNKMTQEGTHTFIKNEQSDLKYEQYVLIYIEHKNSNLPIKWLKSFSRILLIICEVEILTSLTLFRFNKINNIKQTSQLNQSSTAYLLKQLFNQCVGELVARGLDIEFCTKTELLTKVQLKLNTKFTKSANYIFLHTQKAVDVKIISDVDNKEVFSVFGYSLNRLILQDTQMSIKLEVQAINAALVSDRCNLQATNSDFIFVAASFNVSGLILRGMQVCLIENCSVQFRLVGLNVGGIVGFIDQQMKFQMSNTNITGLLKDFNSTEEKTIGFIAAMSEVEQQVNLSYVSLCLIGQYQNVGKGSLENIIQGSWEQLSCEVMCGRFNQIFAYGLCLNETDDPTAFVFQSLFGDVVQDEEPEPVSSSTPVQDSSSNISCDQIIQAQDLILTTCNHQKRIFNLKLKDNIKFTHSINYLFLKTERVQKVQIEIGAQNKQIFAVFGLNNKMVKIISSELNVNLRAQALKAALICEKCNLQTVNSLFVFQASSAQLAGLVLNGERIIQIERCFMQFRLIGMNVGGIVGNIYSPVILNIMDSNYTGILTAFTDTVNVSIGFVAANCSIAEQSVGLNNTSLCIMGKYDNVGTGTLTNNIMSSWEQLSCDAMCGKYSMKFYIGICVEEDDDTSFILTMPNKME